MGDILLYRKMVAPGIIMFLSYVAMLLVVIISISNLTNPDYPYPQLTVFLTLVFGPLTIRIYAEFILLLFKLFESVRNIEKKLESTSTVKSA